MLSKKPVLNTKNSHAVIFKVKIIISTKLKLSAWNF